MPDLALLDELLHRAGDILDRHVRVDAVLIEQVDDVGIEPLERGLRDLLDVFGTAIQAGLFPVGVDVEPELGGDHHLPADRRECLSDQHFVRIGTIDFRGVEEGDPQVDGGSNQGDHLLLVSGRSITEAHAHAAQAHRRDFEPAGSEFALVHRFLPAKRLELGRDECHFLIHTVYRGLTRACKWRADSDDRPLTIGFVRGEENRPLRASRRLARRGLDSRRVRRTTRVDESRHGWQKVPDNY